MSVKLPRPGFIECNEVDRPDGYTGYVTLVDAHKDGDLKQQLDRIEEKLDRILADLER